MIGRTAPLAKLHAAWQNVVNGDRSVFWIAGDAGVGKTTLVEQFISELPGVLVIRGQCVEQYGAGEPYLPSSKRSARWAAASRKSRDLMRAFAPTWLVQLPWLMSGRGARNALSRPVRRKPGAQGSRDRGADGTVHRAASNPAADRGSALERHRHAATARSLRAAHLAGAGSCGSAPIDSCRSSRSRIRSRSCDRSCGCIVCAKRSCSIRSRKSKSPSTCSSGCRMRASRKPSFTSCTITPAGCRFSSRMSSTICDARFAIHARGRCPRASRARSRSRSRDSRRKCSDCSRPPATAASSFALTTLAEMLGQELHIDHAAVRRPRAAPVLVATCRDRRPAGRHARRALRVPPRLVSTRLLSAPGRIDTRADASTSRCRTRTRPRRWHRGDGCGTGVSARGRPRARGGAALLRRGARSALEHFAPQEAIDITSHALASVAALSGRHTSGWSWNLRWSRCAASLARSSSDSHRAKARSRIVARSNCASPCRSRRLAHRCSAESRGCTTSAREYDEALTAVAAPGVLVAARMTMPCSRSRRAALLGVIHTMRGKYLEARRYLERGLEVCE